MREIWCGPFHSGHRARWTAEVRALIEGGAAATVLYVVPTRGLASAVRREVLAGLPGVAGEQVLTLFEVVEQVLRNGDRSYVRLDTVMAERVVAQVLRTSTYNWKGRPLADWAHAPGVAAAFKRHIGELKRAGITPEVLQEAARKGASASDGETLAALAEVYAGYQKVLVGGEVRLLDTEETYAEAARLLRARGLQGVFPQVERVYIDSFTDFQPHQMAVVTPLVQAAHVQVYLPYVAERWAWLEHLAAQLASTIEHWQRAGFVVQTEPAQLPAGVAEDLIQVQEQLFAPHPVAVPDTPNVHVFAARTVEKEWLWVAKQIKTLHHQGVSLHEIALVTNRAYTIGSTARRVFAREGLPVQAAATMTADQVPWIRDLLALYTLPEANWHRETLTQLAAATTLFGTHPLHGHETLPEHFGRAWSVVQGYEAWLQQLNLALSAAEPSEEVVRFGEWLAWLREQTSALEAATTGSEHAAQMRRLLPPVTVLQRRFVEAFQQGTGHGREHLQRDLQGLAALEQVLAEVEKIERVLGMTDAYTCQEFVQLLTTHLAATELTVESGNRAGVAFLRPSAARGLSFAHVFLVGLNEGEWPVPEGASWLIREGVLEEVVPQLTSHVQAEQEKLFFLLALHAAQKGVWLSCVAGSKQDLPSRFLDQLLEICPALTLEGADEYLAGSALFPPTADQISNDRELRDYIATGLATGRADAGALVQQAPLFWHTVLEQATGELEREAGGHSRYDGYLLDPQIQAELAARFSDEQVYSVSLFNRYGECSYKFFLSRVLTLAEDAEEEQELSALEKGNLYHHVLRRLYLPLAELDAITPDVIERLRWELEFLFEAEWSRAQARRKTEVGVRQELEKQRLLQRLRDWFEAEATAWQSNGLPLVPRYLEWVFGMTANRKEHDPRSIAEPVRVGGLKFRGQIDRIDATADGEFFVIDYKTRSLKAIPRDIESGLDFQLPVYLRVAEQVLFPTGSAVGTAYFSIEKADRKSAALVRSAHHDALQMGRKKKLDDEAWQGLLARSEALLNDYRQQIAAGRYPVLPHDKDKCEYCEYQQVCRFQLLRTLKGSEAHG